MNNTKLAEMEKYFSRTFESLNTGGIYFDPANGSIYTKGATNEDGRFVMECNQKAYDHFKEVVRPSFMSCLSVKEEWLDGCDYHLEDRPEWGSPEWLEAVGGIEVLKEIVRIHTQE